MPRISGNEIDGGMPRIIDDDLFELKGGQKEELLLNLIFPDYPDGNESDDIQSTNPLFRKNFARLLRQSDSRHFPCVHFKIYKALNKSGKTVIISICAAVAIFNIK